MSVFDQYRKDAWPIEFKATLAVPMLCGGVPNNEKVAEGWLRSKLADRDAQIQKMIAEVAIERDVDTDEAAKIIDNEQNVNGFKKDANGLFIEGRQVKSAIKEAASVAVASGKLDGRGWGKTNKGLKSYLAEHVVVVEDKIHLNAMEPSGIHQRFIHKSTARGPISAIHYEEYLDGVELQFTVRTDHPFTDREWAMIWLTGEEQGIGASRSQGFGRYEVVSWEQILGDAAKEPKVKAGANGGDPVAA